MVKESTASPSELGDENDDLEVETDEDVEGISRPTKKRKCTSNVGDDVIEVTSDRHCCSCSHENVVEKEHYSVTVSMPQPKPTIAFEYDDEEVTEKLSHLIIMHGLPFRFAESKVFNSLMESVTCQYKKTSRVKAKKVCLNAYDLEKENLMSDLCQDNVKRVSVTIDLWKSGKDALYLVVMCQYVDSDLNLQKRCLNFCEVPPPHSGLVLSDVLHKCLVEWKIEKKVWTVTVDNAACNDVAARILRENLSYNKNLPLNGKLFHVRCFAQMLNLVVQDGLSAIKDVISKVRESVKYVEASETRIKMFSEIAKQLELSSKKLVLDRCTKWNATYSMLSAALDCKDVFSKYQQQDASYALLPNEEEWEKVRVVCSLLKEFNQAYHLQPAFDQIKHLKPGTKCLTSNLFLYDFVSWKRIIRKINMGEDTCMIDMVAKMTARFDKYWRDCNLLMCVAAVLDPRFKMRLLDICFKDDLYSSDEADEFRNALLETLRLLFNEYVEADKANKAKEAKKAKTVKSSTDFYRSSLRSIFEGYLDDMEDEPVKSELDVYLEERNVKNENEFDALSWWKRERNSMYSRFKILSRMAYDVLSIPMTTVTLESAFDAGNRAIDPHYAAMGVARAQVLLCGGEWLRTSYEYMRISQEKDGIQEIDLS